MELFLSCSSDLALPLCVFVEYYQVLVSSFFAAHNSNNALPRQSARLVSYYHTSNDYDTERAKSFLEVI
jgi:hypothetical protein